MLLLLFPSSLADMDYYTSHILQTTNNNIIIPWNNSLSMINDDWAVLLTTYATSPHYISQSSVLRFPVSHNLLLQQSHQRQQHTISAFANTDFMPTFLDFMPNDVHDRIIHYLFSSTKYRKEHFCDACLTDSIADDNILDTLLCYARSGPAQCRSVLREFSNRLYITEDWRRQRVLEWISVTAEYVQTLDIWNAPEISIFGSPSQFPKLERASIRTRPDQLSLIHESPKLRDLTAFITDTYWWGSFVSTVASLRLEALHLHFIIGDTLENLSRGELTSLCTVCPNVEVLTLQTARNITPAAWDMIQGMPSLKHLRVNRRIDDAHVSFIQTLQEIALFDMINIQPVIQFGPLVTNLNFRYAYDNEILEFQALPNLRTLKITIEPGHEIALVGVITNVDDLTLSWVNKGCFHQFERPNGNMIDWHPAYHEPDGKVLEKILSNTKHLKSLHIEKAIVSSNVIIRLLKIAGRKLETFKICHDWQKEPVPNRMECILKGIARYCPNLKTLSLIESVHFDYHTRLRIFATEEQKKRCFRALEEVAEAVPGFKSYRHVRSTILYRFTQEQSEIMTWDDILQGPCFPVGEEDSEDEEGEGEEDEGEEDEDEGEEDDDENNL